MRYLDAYDIIKTEIGGELPSTTGMRFLADMAGEYLVGMHRWRWAVSRSKLLDLRGKITVDNATWTEATKTLTDTGSFSTYTFVDRDQIEIDTGTGATTGFYEVAGKTDANNITLSTSISTSGTNLTTGDIDGKMDLNSVALPADFGQLISLKNSDSIYNDPSGTTLDQIHSLRRNSLYSTGLHSYWYALNTVGDPPEWILEIYPTPEANQIGAWSVLYYRRWVSQTTDSANLIVPELGAVKLLYAEILKAVARGFAESDEGSTDERLSNIERGPIFRAAKSADGTVQPFMGISRGGGADRNYRGRQFSRRAWLSAVVGNPTT